MGEKKEKKQMMPKERQRGGGMNGLEHYTMMYREKRRRMENRGKEMKKLSQVLQNYPLSIVWRVGRSGR